MKIEQYVMAYSVEQDRLRSMMPEGFHSLRPVLRINAEIRDNKTGYVEFNTAVEKDGMKGWLNIDSWENVAFYKDGADTVFHTDFLKITFVRTGLAGGCPAEKDNCGCFFMEADAETQAEPNAETKLRKPEIIAANKEFCDCRFAWSFGGHDARGASEGKTLPAIPTEPKVVYPKQKFDAQSAAAIACKQVLGSYVVCFERS